MRKKSIGYGTGVKDTGSTGGCRWEGTDECRRMRTGNTMGIKSTA